MTTISIDPGACGFKAVVSANKDEARQVRVSIVSDCQMVAALAGEITELGMRDIFTPMDQNVVVKKAGQHRLHAVCPIPCGILKAAEAEFGAALKKDVTFRYSDDNAADEKDQ